MCRCLILLSTYNGEKYLPELLESVLAQKDIYVDILARDDGSTDKTVEILKKYDRVKVYGGNNLKPAKSFLNLIWKADINYDYYALCDQDDVWKEEKIISAVKCIENIDKPALYSSAVEVVDKDLTFIRKSFTDNTFKNPLYDILTYALQMQIQIVMEEAEFVESIRQAQQEPYRVRRIERQIRQLTAEKAHTQGIKEKLYGDYADEILTREDFLNYNELYSKRIEEYSRKIEELEAEQRNLQTAPNAYPFLDVYRKYRKLEEITRPMIVELIEKIEVYEGNRVEITFRFHDEIADLLEELHQKQMGQREVSA